MVQLLNSLSEQFFDLLMQKLNKLEVLVISGCYNLQQEPAISKIIQLKQTFEGIRIDL